MITYLIQLSESDKKKIAIIAIILATIIVLIGVIGESLKKKAESEGKFIDSYMYQLCKYGLIKNTEQFIAYVKNKETRTLYFDTKWKFRLILFTIAFFFVYFYNFKNMDFTVAHQAIDGLSLGLVWPTGNFFGLNIVSSWPVITKQPSPMLNLDGYVVYGSLLTLMLLMLFIINHIFIYYARLKRAKVVVRSVFAPNLDNTTFVR